jgi:hypothetical protein
MHNRKHADPSPDKENADGYRHPERGMIAGERAPQAHFVACLVG